MNERFVVLGVAPVRREWFRRVARWANEATLPIEFVKCISTEEVISRLESGQPFSALLADASAAGLDRDLLDLANAVGCSPIIVDHGLVDRDWESLGARAVLDERFDTASLIDVLEGAAFRISRGDDSIRVDNTEASPTSPTGRVVAVTGAGGIGTSTIAMATAQGLVQHQERQRILLADMALRSSQAMFHDARDIVPGLLELVDAHRLGAPNPPEAQATIHSLPDRGYDLLLGLRSDRDWISIPARALSATWTTLTSTYKTTVCDITDDFDGAAETGSDDIEDRNRLSRMAALHADLVLVIGAPETWGIHHLVRTILALANLGVPTERILPVINHAPRNARVRASITAAVGDLVTSRIPDAEAVASPTFVPHRKSLEATLRDGDSLPSALTKTIADTVSAMLDQAAIRPTIAHQTDHTGEPVAVIPGSLGTWSDDD